MRQLHQAVGRHVERGFGPGKRQFVLGPHPSRHIDQRQAYAVLRVRLATEPHAAFDAVAPAVVGGRARRQADPIDGRIGCDIQHGYGPIDNGPGDTQREVQVMPSRGKRGHGQHRATAGNRDRQALLGQTHAVPVADAQRQLRVVGNGRRERNRRFEREIAACHAAAPRVRHDVRWAAGQSDTEDGRPRQPPRCP